MSFLWIFFIHSGTHSVESSFPMGYKLSGFIGLFTGAVVMSIGYKLFVAWINTGPTAENPEE